MRPTLTAAIAARRTVLAVALPAGSVAALPGHAAAQEVQAVQYLAMGDFFAAGIGAGSPTANSVDGCWADRAHTVRVTNSNLAYPKRVVSALGAQLDFEAFCGAAGQRAPSRPSLSIEAQT